MPRSFGCASGRQVPTRARIIPNPYHPVFAYFPVRWGVCPPPPRHFALWANSVRTEKETTGTDCCRQPVCAGFIRVSLGQTPSCRWVTVLLPCCWCKAQNARSGSQTRFIAFGVPVRGQRPWSLYGGSRKSTQKPDEPLVLQWLGTAPNSVAPRATGVYRVGATSSRGAAHARKRAFRSHTRRRP